MKRITVVVLLALAFVIVAGNALVYADEMDGQMVEYLGQAMELIDQIKAAMEKGDTGEAWRIYWILYSTVYNASYHKTDLEEDFDSYSYYDEDDIEDDNNDYASEILLLVRNGINNNDEMYFSNAQGWVKDFIGGGLQGDNCYHMNGDTVCP